MTTRSTRVVAAGVVSMMLLPAGCGDDDTDDAAAEPTAGTQTDGEAPLAGTDEADAATPDDDGGDSDGVPETCTDIFSASEIDEWFGEPVTLTESTDENLGQLVCTWETVEDPDDIEDGAVSVLTLQVYSGDPIPAANFVDPEAFGDVTMLDGVGDFAFTTDAMLGNDFYFLDEPVAGAFAWSEIRIGDDTPRRHTPEEVEAFFREFHARVTT